MPARRETPVDSRHSGEDDGRVSSPDQTPLSRSFAVARAGFERFTGVPFAVQLPGVAAVLLIFGAMMPWARTPSGQGFADTGGYQTGLAFNTGALTVLIGVAAILLVARLVSRGRLMDPGGLSGLGILAGALVADQAIHIHDDHFYSVGWGLYVSAF